MLFNLANCRLLRYRGSRGGIRNQPHHIDLTYSANVASSTTQSSPIPIITGHRPTIGSNKTVQRCLPNLISPKIARHAVKPTTTIKCGCLNIRSINNKVDDVLRTLHEENLQALALTETWHEGTDSIALNQLRSMGFTVIDVARPTNKAKTRNKINFVNHGGVAIIAQPGYTLTQTDIKFKPTTFEYLCCRFNSKKENILLAVIYRPSSETVTSVFFNEFSALLSSFSSMSVNVVITGDINIHIERISSSECTQYHELIKSFGFNQHVKAPTHNQGGWLDHLITSEGFSPTDIEIHDMGISDHSLVTWNLHISPSSPPYSTVIKRCWKQFNCDEFKYELANSELNQLHKTASDTSVDELVSIFESTLLAILDKHAPARPITIRTGRHQPWLDEECRIARRATRRLARVYRRNKSNATAEKTWRQSLRAMRKLCNSKATKFWKDKLNDAGSDQRRVWRSVDHLLGKNATAPRPQFDAATYKSYIEKKVADIRAHTSGSPTFPTRGDSLLAELKLVSPTEVVRLIREAPSKQCSLDIIPTWLVKASAELLAPFLAVIFNKSFSTGIFPLSWKHAKVTPLLKKPGLDLSLPSSFRPVSNLAFLSKILERIANHQITQYLNTHHLFPVHQSAYRTYHSTESALLKVFSDIVNAIDKGQIALLALLDLTAAFDTVDHDILIRRLQLSFGISGQALMWFQSYLTDRKQTIDLHGACSTSQILCGVPQGSVLGPLLFSLYAADVERIVCSNGLHNHCYADDTQLYFYCNPNETASLKIQFEKCIDEISSWAASNKLQLNKAKTEFLWVTMNRRRNTRDISDFQLSDSCVAPVDTVRNLGLQLDGLLTMTDHVTRLIRDCFFHLRRIRTIRRLLPTSTAIKIVNSFIVSRVDYCNSLLTGLSTQQLYRLQSIMNCAARIIYGKARQEHITPLLRDNLHWLRFPERISYKLCLLVFKSMNGLAPSYLSDFCVPASSGTSHNLRSHDSQKLQVPRTNTKFGEKSFLHSGPRLWNDLPVQIRSTNSLSSFKKLLKSHLFAKSYGLNVAD